MQWWSDRVANFPHIAMLALKYLVIPTSSDPSERVFSQLNFGVTNFLMHIKKIKIQWQLICAVTGTGLNPGGHPSNRQRDRIGKTWRLAVKIKRDRIDNILTAARQSASLHVQIPDATGISSYVLNKVLLALV